MQVATTQTRQCPFCAETILVAAVKCRYCGEFLNTNRAQNLIRQATAGVPAGDQESEPQEQDGAEDVLFAGEPSLWAMAGAVVKGGLVLALAIVIVFWHIEKLSALKLSFEHAAVVGRYRVLFGLGLGLIVVLVLAYKAMVLKMTRYEVVADRIEYSRGIFDREVDNLDMFRVVDIRLRRSLLDCVVGVGTVVLTTSDKSHPEFTFAKIRESRGLYDAIKKASLIADRKSGVIHLE